MKDKRILDLDTDNVEDHGFIVTSAYGLAFEAHDNVESARHVKGGFENMAKVRKALKDLQPCKCLRCTSLGRSW